MLTGSGAGRPGSGRASGPGGTSAPLAAIIRYGASEAACAFGTGGGRALVARQLHQPAQHLDEAAGDRQVRPGRLRRDVEEHERALFRGVSPVTSGVPSARLAQVRSTMSEVGSASTCRVTVTSLGGARSEKGPARGNSVTGCGVVQDSAPPSARSPSAQAAPAEAPRRCRPRRAASRRSGPACRPSSPSRPAAARAASGMVPTSAITIIAGFCSSSCGIASARSGLDGSTRSAKGESARRM